MERCEERVFQAEDGTLDQKGRWWQSMASEEGEWLERGIGLDKALVGLFCCCLSYK